MHMVKHNLHKQHPPGGRGGGTVRGRGNKYAASFARRHNCLPSPVVNPQENLHLDGKESKEDMMEGKVKTESLKLIFTRARWGGDNLAIIPKKNLI